MLSVFIAVGKAYLAVTVGSGLILLALVIRDRVRGK
jgi:hypothetical protein